MTRMRAHESVLVVFAALLGLLEGPAQIAAAAAVVTTLVATDREVLTVGWPEVGIAVWWAAGLVGVFAAPAPPSSEGLFRPLHALAFLVGSCGLARAGPRVLVLMAWAFGIAIVVNGAYGYLQVAFGELPLDRLLAWNPSHRQRVVPGTSAVMAASGLFYHRLKLSHVGLVGLGFFGLLLTNERVWKRRGCYVAIVLGTAILSGAVALTYVRAVPVALVVAAVAAALVLGRPKLLLWVLLLLGALVGILFLSEHGRAHLLNAKSHLSIRGDIAWAGVRVFVDNPVVGVGHGMYGLVSASYGFVGVEGTSPHNLPLQVLAETGLVGFVGFCVAVTAPLVRLVASLRRSRDDSGPAATLERLAFVTLTAYLCLGLVHFPLHKATVSLLFWLALGIAAQRTRRWPVLSTNSARQG